jgi:predicted nucleic acid-binding protein
MAQERSFIDSNLLLYLLSDDQIKADRVEALLLKPSAISVQVLNEISSVARRKLSKTWVEIDELLGTVRQICEVEPLTENTYDHGRRICERYQLSFYDSMIVAAALLAQCQTLYSEDMQDGLIIEGTLRINNPFLQ